MEPYSLSNKGFIETSDYLNKELLSFVRKYSPSLADRLDENNTLRFPTPVSCLCFVALLTGMISDRSTQTYTRREFLTDVATASFGVYYALSCGCSKKLEGEDDDPD